MREITKSSIRDVLEWQMRSTDSNLVCMSLSEDLSEPTQANNQRRHQRAAPKHLFHLQ